jgi:hypothetical protein
MSRRYFLLSSAAFSAGCAMNRTGAPATSPAPAVRAPQVGQSWRYAKHDLITRAVLDIEVNEVSTVGQTVAINSRTDDGTAAKAAPASWGIGWLRRYFRHDRPDGPLPGEVQAPWGRILVDPHWGHVQAYEAPLPLWPSELRTGWKTRVQSKYKSDESELELRWDQEMKAEAWETISVPAGQFKVLRYVNSIRFRDADQSRKDSRRHETIWFAPEVGRWVARESSGTYYLDDSVDDRQQNDIGFRWELLGWT